MTIFLTWTIKVLLTGRLFSLALMVSNISHRSWMTYRTKKPFHFPNLLKNFLFLLQKYLSRSTGHQNPRSHLFPHIGVTTLHHRHHHQRTLRKLIGSPIIFNNVFPLRRAMRINSYSLDKRGYVFIPAWTSAKNI